jgi:cell pole-organizing protein PopZ
VAQVPDPDQTDLSNEPPSKPPLLGEDDVLELTEAMIAPADDLMSGRTTQTSSDVLGELARAIMERREMGLGDKDVTLEGMVREMMRPLLREWLDRNLPYLIERLVKKEIDKMVNRAEMFEEL